MARRYLLAWVAACGLTALAAVVLCWLIGRQLATLQTGWLS